jgi:hypothetical protein
MEPLDARILLHRRINVVQPALLYRVNVDERQVARLAVSQRRTVGVLPGRHTVQAKVLWMSSPELPVDVAPGQSVQVDIGPDVRHLWNMALRPHRFLRLDAVQEDRLLPYAVPSRKTMIEPL